MTRKTCKWAMRAIALSLACHLANTSTNAAPYACDLTNNSGVISFRLNENADNVKVIVGGVTNDLGAGVKGVTTTNLGIPGIFKVVVTRSAPAGYTLSSDDAYLDGNGVYVNKFEQPRGIAVNKNPATPSFGRIFVANGRAGSASTGSPARTTYQGIYMINSDDSVALDTGFTPSTAGLPFATAGTGSPARLMINPDDNRLYMADVSDSNGGVWVSDLDVATNSIATNVLGTIGDLTINAANNHGSIYSMVVNGSLAGGTLKVFTSDEDLSPVRSVWRYNVGSGPLPYSGTTNGPLATAPIANTTLDLTQGGTNKYLYYTQNRSSGTEVNGPSIRILREDGTVVTNSQDASRTFLGNPSAADLYRNILALDIAPDGNSLAVVQGSDYTGRVMIIPLTNGVFSFAASNVFSIAGLDTTSRQNNTRDIAFDAAGNIYIINTAVEWFRIYSKGGPTEAITGSDGTFSIGVPNTLVTVAATTANALENSGTNGVFTLTRSGDTSGSLTVNFVLSGTASNTVDYTVSNSTNVTFAAGQTNATVTITPINNSTAQLTRTVILSIVSGSSYSGGVPATATVSLLDDETPTISISPIKTKLLEGYSASSAKYQITRKGLLASALNVPIAYSGTAVAGSHFSGPSSVSISAGVQTTTITVTPIDDEVYQGERIGILQLSSGGGYVLDTNSSSFVTITDDEFPVGSLLFTENFNTAGSNTSPNWNVFSSDGFANSHADFGFNYTSLYVPQLPGSADTLALKLQVTNATVDSTAVTLSPSSLNLGSSDYRLKFKMWINYNGPMFDGGSGSTFHLTAGVGTSGDHVNYPSGFGVDGVSFAMDGDGGTHGTPNGDCNAYIGNTLQQDESGVYAAGTTDTPRVTTNTYYSIWGGLTAPAAQLSHYSSQTGTSAAGNLGISWHTVTLTKVGGTVTWHIDGILIATIVVDPLSLSQNVFVGYEDLFAGTDSSNPTMSFALVDNLKVESYVAPTPIGAKVYNTQKSGNNIVINFVGGSTNVPSDFTLLGSSTLSTNSASYTTVAGQSITGSNGIFQAVAPLSGATQFYRIKQ